MHPKYLFITWIKKNIHLLCFFKTAAYYSYQTSANTKARPDFTHQP